MRIFKARRCMRQRVWQAMRILRRFTIPDLCRVIDGATIANVQSFVSRLYKEGFVGKIGQVKRGYAGQYQSYQLVNDIGATMPVFLKGRHKKETELDKETDKKTNEVVENKQVTDFGKLTPAESGGLP